MRSRAWSHAIVVLLALGGLIGDRACAQLTATQSPEPLGKPRPYSEPPDKQSDEKKENGEKKKNGEKNGKEEDQGNKDDKEKKEEEEDQRYSIHAQNTLVSQGNSRFHSPYAGPNSLLPENNLRMSDTTTLFLGTRLWNGGELYFNPEVAGGRGLSDVHGMAGFPNGEITRVGKPEPTPYIARLFLRQTFGLGGGTEDVEDGPNQLAETRDRRRLTFVVGKMAATDCLDNNKYSNDPRTQFLNWSLMYNGAWDYPANVRGYTYGGVADLTLCDWSFRYGIFAEPNEANGSAFDRHILDANGQFWEAERRFEVNEHPGKIHVFGYLNHAHMGNYRESLALSPINPDITQTRAYRFKYGFGVNLEQEITAELGAFFRAGWNDGHSESWAFTEIDRTVAFGALLKGSEWRRPQDQVGLAFAFNGISGPHRDYLAAGGLGFILGDGALNYSPEIIMETFYSWELRKFLTVTLDYQCGFNPGYNADRGPVSIGALRVHLAF